MNILSMGKSPRKHHGKLMNPKVIPLRKRPYGQKPPPGKILTLAQMKKFNTDKHGVSLPKGPNFPRRETNKRITGHVNKHKYKKGMIMV